MSADDRKEVTHPFFPIRQRPRPKNELIDSRHSHGPLCQENGFSCKKTYPNCDFKSLLSLCFINDTYYCMEKDPGDNDCQRCTEPGYHCANHYPNCNSEYTVEVCVSNKQFLCVERLSHTLPSSTHHITTPVPTVTTPKVNTSLEECNFSKIGLRPPESVTVCRENCLPVNTYIDLSKIGICSQGVCCLNKIQTTEKCAGTKGS
ncbi:unnamed protein product [Acanthosepion pharaonis]|uniref:Uncharacterized protein n=1 Tax=Acanthosepion pharaonis TaxID=158019 RepID=A0A812CNK3_ACAPH|nr:unnamed protein product [Sepia pharaonis]